MCYNFQLYTNENACKCTSGKWDCDEKSKIMLYFWPIPSQTILMKNNFTSYIVNNHITTGNFMILNESSNRR